MMEADDWMVEVDDWMVEADDWMEEVDGRRLFMCRYCPRGVEFLFWYPIRFSDYVFCI